MIIVAHQITVCPNCKAQFALKEPRKNMLLARLTCPVCKKEFLIDEGKPEKIRDNS
jgi:uncharacterized protein YbaR (Trm112 family)